MVLRWYTVVIDCHDVRKQAAWWAEAFDWKTIIETDDECVNVPGWVEPETVHGMPWERIGPSSPRSFAPHCLSPTNRLYHLVIGKDLHVSSWKPLTKRLCWRLCSTPNVAGRMSCS